MFCFGTAPSQPATSPNSAHNPETQGTIIAIENVRMGPNVRIYLYGPQKRTCFFRGKHPFTKRYVFNARLNASRVMGALPGSCFKDQDQIFLDTFFWRETRSFFRAKKSVDAC